MAAPLVTMRLLSDFNRCSVAKCQAAIVLIDTSTNDLYL